MGTVILIAFVYVLPAAIAFFWFHASEPNTKVGLPTRALLAVGILVFVAKMGFIAKYGAYAPWVWSLGIVLGAITLAPRLVDLPLAIEVGDLVKAGVCVVAAIGLVGVAFSKAASARTHESAPVHLTFPLRAGSGGTYLVLEGGSGTFFGGLAAEGRAQRLAVDIVKLDAMGFRTSSAWATEPNAFEIFDEAITAPCDGNVLAAEDDKPDLPPSQDDAISPLGNFVAIGCPEVTVVLTHLRRGSLKTPKNVTVHVGDALARVGSSGRGGEPKLRIFALRGTESTPDRIASQGQGVPMAFSLVGDGALVRGDRL